MNFLCLYERCHNEGRMTKITVAECREVVGMYYQIRKETMIGPLGVGKGMGKIARPRQMVMALARELTNASHPRIVKHLGRKDHTTSVWAVKRIRFLEANRPAIKTDMDNFRLTLLTYKYQQDATTL